jgi:hypothetical protein
MAELFKAAASRQGAGVGFGLNPNRIVNDIPAESGDTSLGANPKYSAAIPLAGPGPEGRTTVFRSFKIQAADRIDNRLLYLFGSRGPFTLKAGRDALKAP